jgi:PAS domain S-box-containing protein
MTERRDGVGEQPLQFAVANVEAYAVFTLAVDGTVGSWNRGCVRIFGYPEAAMVGADVSTLAVDEARLSAAVETARRVGHVETDLRLRRADGTTVAVGLALATVSTAPDREHGFLAVATEREDAPDLAGDAVPDPLVVHEVVGDLVREAATATDRERLEATVCGALAETPFYGGAWVARRSHPGERLGWTAGEGDRSVRALLESLVAAGASTPAVDDAFEAGAVRRLRNVHVDDRLSRRVRRRLHEDGCRSVLLLPLVRETTVDGVLVVHSSRRAAFDRAERTPLETLAAVLAGAEAALERRDLLFARHLVELELADGGDRALFVAVAERCDARTRLDGVVVGDGGGLRQVLTVEGATAADLRAATADGDLAAAVDVDEAGPPVRATVAPTSREFVGRLVAAGSAVRRGEATPTDRRVALAAPSTVADRLFALLEREFPDWTLARKRTVDRPWVDGQTADGLADRLTERQREVLVAAYREGYLDHPRRTTAERLAEDLGIADTTLFQHLQAAQRKLVEACLDVDDVDG